MTQTTDELIAHAKKFQTKMNAQVVHRLLQKGLKLDWSTQTFVGFLSVMASLHKQTKHWKWPSNALYLALDPSSITTLVLCLEEERKG